MKKFAINLTLANLLKYLTLLMLFLCTKTTFANAKNNFSKVQDKAQDEKKKLTLNADKVNFTNEVEGKRIFNAEGDVKVDYDEYTLCGGVLYLNENEDMIRVRKNVVLTQNTEIGSVIKTEEVKSNRDFSLMLAPEIEFEKGSGFGNATKFEKKNELYYLQQIKLSSCKNDRANKTPSTWSISAKNAKYDKEIDRLYFYNSTFLIKDVPVMWFPFFTIQPSRTHGFLAPEVGYQNGQIYARTPYFISEKTKTHYLVITPEFWFNESQTTKEEGKTFNIDLDYKYTKNQDTIKFTSKFAPNAFLQDDLTGKAIDEKGSRYSAEVNLDFSYKYGNYGLNQSIVSDRYFRRFYMDIKDENYLTNDVFINYFDFERSQSGVIETANFTPILFEKADELARINFYTDYTKSFNINKDVEVYDRFNSVNFVKNEGYQYTRLTNSVGLKYEFNPSFVQSRITPELRIDYYNKNYSLAFDVPHNSKNESLARYISSIYIENSIPVYFKIQNVSSFLFTVEPLLNVGVTKQNINQDKIFQEDFISSVFDINTIFLKDFNLGYDLVEEGITANYGVKAKINHFNTKTKIEVVGGQRLRRDFEKSDITYSDYAINATVRSLSFLYLKRDMILNTNGVTLKSIDEIQLNFEYIDLGFERTYMKASFVKSITNIDFEKYFLTIKMFEKKLHFKSSVEFNNNFIESNNSIVRKNVATDFNLTYIEDCFEYALGLKRERYLITDIDKKYRIYGSIKLIF